MRKFIVEYKDIGLYAVVAVFLTDFAVAMNASQIKTGSIALYERVEKYSQFLRIEQLENSTRMSSFEI